MHDLACWALLGSLHCRCPCLMSVAAARYLSGAPEAFAARGCSRSVFASPGLAGAAEAPACARARRRALGWGARGQRALALRKTNALSPRNATEGFPSSRRRWPRTSIVGTSRMIAAWKHFRAWTPVPAPLNAADADARRRASQLRSAARLRGDFLATCARHKWLHAWCSPGFCAPKLVDAAHLKSHPAGSTPTPISSSTRGAPLRRHAARPNSSGGIGLLHPFCLIAPGRCGNFHVFDGLGRGPWRHEALCMYTQLHPACCDGKLQWRSGAPQRPPILT